MTIFCNCTHIILSNFSAANVVQMIPRPVYTVVLRSGVNKANLPSFCVVLNASWDVSSPSFTHCSYSIRLFLPIPLFILNSILLLNWSYWLQCYSREGKEFVSGDQIARSGPWIVKSFLPGIPLQSTVNTYHTVRWIPSMTVSIVSETFIMLFNSMPGKEDSQSVALTLQSNPHR